MVRAYKLQKGDEVNIPTPQEIHDNAVAHGWYEEEKSVPEMLCLIHSEVSEGLEGYRNHVKDGEKGCLSEELADVVIRVFDMSAYLGIDIEEAIITKHEYNRLRPYRHGGKKC